MERKLHVLGYCLILAMLAMVQACQKHSPSVYRDGPAQSYVQIENGRFTLDSTPFSFVGSNYYRLGLSDAFFERIKTETKDGSVVYPQIDQALADYAQEGMKVVRLWGFACEDARVSPVEPPLLNKDLSLNILGMRQLDYAIASAGRHGLRVILPLVNYEREYCGMDWWVEQVLGANTKQRGSEMIWSCMEAGSHIVESLAHTPAECIDRSTPTKLLQAVPSKEQFYSNAKVKMVFKKHIQKILERKNVYSGFRYADDPALFAIEVSNEAHTADYYECLSSAIGIKTYQTCKTEDPSKYQAGQLVYSWLEEMSAYIRSLDSNHLIASGEEGYRSKHDNPDCLGIHDWLSNGSKGVDFDRNATIKNLDFLTTHLYPDNWNIKAEQLDWFNRCFIQDRAQIAQALKKPIIAEEAGFNEQEHSDRSEAYRLDRAHYLSRIYRYANQSGYQGTLVWQASPLTLGDKVAEDDAFTFPIKEKKGDRYVYSPEGRALNQQVACSEHLNRGGKAEECLYICPSDTPINAEGLGKDPEGLTCYLQPADKS